MAGSQDKWTTRGSVTTENNSTEPSASFELFVRATLTSMSTKMDTILAGQAAIEKCCEALESRVDVNSTDIKNIQNSINFDSAQIKDNTTDLEQLKKLVTEHGHELKCSSQCIAILEMEMNNLQRYTRGFKIRILDVAEEENEGCLACVESILKDNFDVSGRWIWECPSKWKAYRRKMRHIIARFYSHATSHSARAVAREKLAETGVWITDDLIPRDLVAKKCVILLMNQLYSDKQNHVLPMAGSTQTASLSPKKRLTPFFLSFQGTDLMLRELNINTFQSLGTNICP